MVPFNYIFRLLALLPQTYNKREKSYAIFVAVAMFCSNLYVSYYTWKNVISTSIGIIKMVKSLCMILSNLLSIICVNFSHNALYDDFKRKLFLSSIELGKLPQGKGTFKTYIVFLLTHMTFIGLIVYASCAADGTDTSRSMYILNFLNFYPNFIFCIKIYAYIYLIKMNIEELNNRIGKFNMSSANFKLKYYKIEMNRVGRASIRYEQLKQMNLIYVTLCEAVNGFNRVFGGQILILIFLITTSCLLSVGFIVFDYFNNTHGSIRLSGMHYRIVLILWTIFLLVSNVLFRY